jgi:hypothetical protein
MTGWISRRPPWNLGRPEPSIPMTALGTDHHGATRRRSLTGHGTEAPQMRGHGGRKRRKVEEGQETSRDKARPRASLGLCVSGNSGGGGSRHRHRNNDVARWRHRRRNNDVAAAADPDPGWRRPGACNLLPLTSPIYSISTKQPNRPPRSNGHSTAGFIRPARTSLRPASNWAGSHRALPEEPSISFTCRSRPSDRTSPLAV